MPYCRRCGAKLEEDARFCHKCGTQVVTYVPPPPPVAPAAPRQPPKPWRKDPIVILAIGLVVILLSAAIVAVLLVAPLSTWDLGRSLEDDTPNVNKLNLNFETNIGQVDVTTLKIQENNVGIYVRANGSRGLFGGTDIPVSISFDNQTVGDVLTVNSKVEVENQFSLQSNVEVTIFVDPALDLNLNVTSKTGQVSLTADKPTTIQSLNLKTTTGTTQTNLENVVTVAGNISLKTTTGSVHYRMNEPSIMGNNTINLQSTIGSVNIELTKTYTFQGNLEVNAATTTGAINVGLEIDNGVGAKITSHTNLGDIDTDVTNFSGDKSPIQSNNYPAPSNIEINNRVSTGSVNIQATYLSTVIPN